MTDERDDLPLATTDREEHAQRLFPYRLMSAEEYAARNAQDWGCFSFHEYRYRDGALSDWITRLGVIFFTPGEVERCRRQFLTQDEYRAVIEREAEEF